MSTTGIGSSSNVPGFDVLFPSGVPSPTSVSATNATPATVSNATSNTTSGDGLNSYQQAVANLDQWQTQIFQESVDGDTSGATNALYASAGLTVDQFANLAAQLQNIESSGTTGTNVNTTA